jgi:UDP-GlcNAc3NAcA epimerase
MKILSIIGARPEFIQAAPVSKALRHYHTEILVHTGQHYDYLMSQVFFDELGIPIPDYNLEVGSDTHANQTAEIMVRLEQILLEEKPNFIFIRGDTNSTLASAITASKLSIPIAHIEAGERSYDRQMPEEINRLVADHLAKVHFCASQKALDQLSLEGISENVFWVGDVMLDALLLNLPLARQKSNILDRLELIPREYSLVTVHRAANTNDQQRLRNIISGLNQAPETIVFPVHPRTRKSLEKIDVDIKDHVKLIEPVDYLDMLLLEENARLIATDSGGVQREAYFLEIPCLTLRDETEWVETVNSGWNKLVGTQPEGILKAWMNFRIPVEHPPLFGDGNAGKHIANIITNENFHLKLENEL